MTDFNPSLPSVFISPLQEFDEKKQHLSLFDMVEDSRTNLFEEGGIDASTGKRDGPAIEPKVKNDDKDQPKTGIGV